MPRRYLSNKLVFVPTWESGNGVYHCPACESSWYIGGRALHEAGCDRAREGYSGMEYRFGPKEVVHAIHLCESDLPNAPAPLDARDLLDKIEENLPGLYAKFKIGIVAARKLWNEQINPANDDAGIAILVGRLIALHDPSNVATDTVVAVTTQAELRRLLQSIRPYKKIAEDLFERAAAVAP